MWWHACHRVVLKKTQQNRRCEVSSRILYGIGTTLAFPIITEADDGVVGPGVRETLQGSEGGKVRKLACPAHMGAWPEREAPAGRFTSVHLTVEKGEGFVLPLFSQF